MSEALLLARLAGTEAAMLWPSAPRPAGPGLAARLAPGDGLARLLDSLSPRPQPLAEPAPPPPDLDAIRAEAHAAGVAIGFDAGHAAGSAAAEAGLAPLRADLAEAAAALHAACVIDAAALAPLLADLVRALAETVLAAELARPQALLPLATTALALVETATAPTLCAHPDTLARLAPHLPGLATAVDAGLARDAFRLDGPDFVVPVDLAQRLAAALEGIG